MRRVERNEDTIAWEGRAYEVPMFLKVYRSLARWNVWHVQSVAGELTKRQLRDLRDWLTERIEEAEGRSD